jgi:hypothetical protein
MSLGKKTRREKKKEEKEMRLIFKVFYIITRVYSQELTHVQPLFFERKS